jgi:2-polyprenyl-6-hydroxyphenyl methylase/3-demethylubiquinone-9 3-methyltransferase
VSWHALFLQDVPGSWQQLGKNSTVHDPIVDGFLRYNERCSNWIEARLPRSFVTQLKDAHEERAKNAAANFGIVLDVGAGAMSPFARAPRRAFVMGIDISAQQIARNRDIDAGIVANALQLPIRDSVADVVVTRTLIEHLSDTKAFMYEVARVLKLGGVAIHVFPGRCAPFAVLNRILPERAKRHLLLGVIPESRGLQGFPAFYDRCTEPNMRRLLRDLGFVFIDSRCYYYQSLYYKKFCPLYLLSLVYDLIVWRLDIRILASQILIVAKR